MQRTSVQVPLAAALVLAVSIPLSAQQQVCSVIPVNGDTPANIGVALPKGATFGGVRLSVRRYDVAGDQYSDCTPVGLCTMPHSDAANVSPWAVLDVDGRAVYGNLVYNAKGAPIKWFRLCAAYAVAGTALKKGDELDKANAADLSKPVDLKKLFAMPMPSVAPLPK